MAFAGAAAPDTTRFPAGHPWHTFRVERMADVAAPDIASIPTDAATEQSWKQHAGRRSGGDEYHVGDLTRGEARKFCKKAEGWANAPKTKDGYELGDTTKAQVRRFSETARKLFGSRAQDGASGAAENLDAAGSDGSPAEDGGSGATIDLENLDEGSSAGSRAQDESLGDCESLENQDQDDVDSDANKCCLSTEISIPTDRVFRCGPPQDSGHHGGLVGSHASAAQCCGA